MVCRDFTDAFILGTAMVSCSHLGFLHAEPLAFHNGFALASSFALWHSGGGDTPAGAGESVNLRCINGEEILLITIRTK